MSPILRSAPAERGAALAGALLLAVAAAAWIVVVRTSSGMGAMEPAGSLLGDALTFTLLWGVMMTAMMLPSAAPMILLYRTVRRGLAASGDRSLPPALFAALYLAVWLLVGVPVWAGGVVAAWAGERWPAVARALPYGVAAALAAAGAYQLTPLKRACLRHCEAPLSFLMGRWRPGRAASLGLALSHALYCLGCCWGLMLILVAAGAMSLPWVLAITVLVFAEKVIPFGQTTARVAGYALLVLAAAVALRPELAGTLRSAPTEPMPMEMEMDMPMMPMRR